MEQGILGFIERRIILKGRLQGCLDLCVQWSHDKRVTVFTVLSSNSNPSSARRSYNRISCDGLYFARRDYFYLTAAHCSGAPNSCLGFAMASTDFLPVNAYARALCHAQFPLPIMFYPP